MVMKIDFHRAGVGARAAERRRIGQMLKFVETAQVGRKHAADRALIRGAVTVAADRAKHRTRVQTRAAANALQHVALLCVRQQFAAAVVEQDHVKLLGAVGFVRLARAADQRVVAGDGLAGAGVASTGQRIPRSCSRGITFSIPEIAT